MTERPSGVACVLPRVNSEWSGAAAMWVTAAGWATAARDRLGAGWVVSPNKVALERVGETTKLERVLKRLDASERTRP